MRKTFHYTMYLRPSEIRFSQDSIGSTFGRCTSHPYRPIGETLDDILNGHINVHSIPSISVVKQNGLWFTADNRRLWVFQEAEKRGKCDKIYVRESGYINYNKMTTLNDGVSVYVRGNPGGYIWKRMPEKEIQIQQHPEIESHVYVESSRSTYVYQEKIKEVDSTSILLAIENRGTVAGVTITKPLQDFPKVDSFENVSDDEEEIDINGNSDFGCDDQQGVDVSTSVHSDKSDPKQLVQASDWDYPYLQTRSETNENSNDEKKMDDINEVEIDEPYYPTCNIPTTSIASSSSHLDSSGQMERSTVALNMDEEANTQKLRCGNKNKIIIVCVCVFLIGLLILSLSLSLS